MQTWHLVGFCSVLSGLIYVKESNLVWKVLSFCKWWRWGSKERLYDNEFVNGRARIWNNNLFPLTHSYLVHLPPGYDLPNCSCQSSVVWEHEYSHEKPSPLCKSYGANELRFPQLLQTKAWVSHSIQPFSHPSVFAPQPVWSMLTYYCSDSTLLKLFLLRYQLQSKKMLEPEGAIEVSSDLY